jgi:hypothetical protein
MMDFPKSLNRIAVVICTRSRPLGVKEALHSILAGRPASILRLEH